jgi:hypothetical protein
LHLIIVADDDYLAVTRRPEDVAVEVAKKLSSELLITRSTGIRVFASSGRGLPSAEGEWSRLTPFLSSIGG